VQQNGRSTLLGPNSGPVFRPLRTKIHQIKSSPYTGKTVVCNAVFRLVTYCSVPEMCVVKSKVVQNLTFSLQVLGEGPQILRLFPQN